jgi:large subunit ribosomal protein L30
VADLLIRQVRSANGTSPRQRDTLRSLRLGRIGRTVERSDSPELRGMLTVVDHLVEVEGAKRGGGDS